eukprot:s6839_g1.t3
MQSFYPRSADTGAKPTLKPEDVWRAVCLIPEGMDPAQMCQPEPERKSSLVLLREPRKRLGGTSSRRAPSRPQRPPLRGSSPNEDAPPNRSDRRTESHRSAPVATAPSRCGGTEAEPVVPMRRAREPVAVPAPARHREESECVQGTRSAQSIPTGSTSLVELIDRGTYGMGPAGRRAPSRAPSASAGRAESLPPQAQARVWAAPSEEPRRGMWDQGTRASLEQAARASLTSRQSQLRARSAWAEGSERRTEDSDPWAAYFNPELRTSKEEAMPVWGKLPLRLKRERSQRPVKEGAAELTTGHIPVLRDESINCLLGGPDGTEGFYADGTFGRGGHSTEILRRLSDSGRLWAFDVDPNAIAVGRKLEELDQRFSMIHRPFADVHKSLPDGLELSGMLLDIGFSSPQVDDGGRGWSCYQDGPLDLRMNFKAGIPAWKWLQTATPGELAWVVYENGEDDDPILCHRIAEAALERQRRCGPYTSTLELSTCIQEVKRGLDDRRQHPAKLAFQGIRNFINQEMQQLADAMSAQFQRLKYGGRAVVITFKPREEQVLENWLRQNEDGWASPLASQVSPDRLGELFPLLSSVQPYAARRLMAPIRPSAEEVRRNSRSRSAMVHTFIKEPRRPPFQKLGPCLRSSGSSNGKPGDWLCTHCRGVNAAHNETCQKCVSSYVEVSKALGQGWSPRSVGQALKQNPHAPVVPCHRIVRADRSLGGYFGATSLEDAQVKTKADSSGGYLEDHGT